MDINRLLCKPTTDVNCILIAKPFAKAVAAVKSFITPMQFATATA